MCGGFGLLFSRRNHCSLHGWYPNQRQRGSLPFASTSASVGYEQHCIRR
jgi:hypothetical protein